MRALYRTGLALLIGIMLLPLHGLAQTAQTQPKPQSSHAVRHHKRAKTGNGATVGGTPMSDAAIAAKIAATYSIWGRRTA